MSLLISIGVIFALYAVISWAFPSVPTLISAAIGLLGRTLVVYLVALLIVVVVILGLFLSVFFASISMLSLTVFWLMAAITYLAVHFRRNIAAAFAGIGINRNALIVISVGVGLLFLISIGSILGREVVAAISILVAIILTLLVYLPHGFILKLLGYQEDLIPLGLRTVLAGIAFVAFFGLMYPGVITLQIVLVTALAALILSLSTSSSGGLRIGLSIMVIAMILNVTWKHSDPDSYRAVLESLNTKKEVFTTSLDQGRLEDRSEIAATYGRLNRDVSVLYTFDVGQKTGQDTCVADTVTLEIDSLVRVFDHKGSAKRFQGQEFIEVQIAKNHGAFVGGKRYWIEADYIDVLSVSQINNRRKPDATVIVNESNVSFISHPHPEAYGRGVHNLNLIKGQKKSIKIADCSNYNFNKDCTIIVEANGKVVNSWDGIAWPNANELVVTNLSHVPVSLIVN